MSKRIEWLDIAKGLGIILVIMGHVNAFNHHLKVWIYAFHMPLFFFLAGITLAPYKDTFIDFFRKKANHLYIPFVVWGLIYSSLNFKNVLLILYGNSRTLAKAGSLSSLWFLVALFGGLIITRYLAQLNKRYLRIASAVLLLLLSAFVAKTSNLFPVIKSIGTPYGIDSLLCASCFILIGYEFKDSIKKFQRMSTNVIGTICIGAFAVSCFSFVNTTPSDSYVNISRGILNNVTLFGIFAFVGILLIVSLSMIAERLNLTLRRAIEFVGQKSMPIFLVHKPIISEATKLAKCLDMPESFSLCLVTLFVLILSLAISVIIEKYIPMLFGINSSKEIFVNDGKQFK